MREKASRLENSKDARRILNRFGVDLTQCQYTVAGREIRLTGWLLKVDGSDFQAQEIESMVQEFTSVLKGFFVSGDMENWKFTSDHLQCVGDEEGEEGEHQEEAEAEAV